MMRQSEPGRPQADDQHFSPTVRTRQRPANVQRIPPRQQRVNFKTPGQRQHILQDVGFGLRNIDRLLLLIDAGFHAIVADAMSGRGHHRIVDGDGGERAQDVTGGAQRVHLADFLVQRAARQSHAERRFLKRAGFAVDQAFAAGILTLRVAPDAVVDLVQRALGCHAGIGQRETVAMPPVVLGQTQHGDAVAHDGFNRNQMQWDRPVAARGTWCRRDGSAGPRESGWPRRRSVKRRRGPRCRRLFPIRSTAAAKTCSVNACTETVLQRRPQCRDRRTRTGPGISCTAWRCTNSRLHACTGSSAKVSRQQCVDFRLDAEQLGDKRVQMRAEIDDQRGFVLGRQRVRRGARGQQAQMQRRIRLRQTPQKRQRPAAPIRHVPAGPGT